MDYKMLNKVLKNLQSPTKDLEFISKQDIHIGVPDGGDGSQGDENSYYNIYKFKDEDLYISVEYYTDSYGNGEYIRGIQFVKETEKKVKSYDPI